MKTTVICPSCKHEQTLDVTFKVNYFGCVSCFRYYDYSSGNPVLKETFKPFYFERSINLGAVGTFDKNDFVVTSVVVKTAGGLDSWAEYTLENAAGKSTYISEAQGHFIKMDVLEATFDTAAFEKTQIYDGVTYTRLAALKPRARLAIGFFENDALSTYDLAEFIAPPHIVSRERYPQNEVIWYKGAHLSRSTVKKSFKGIKMAGRYGIGMVQPFYFEPFRLAQILLVTCLLVIGITMFRNYGRQTKIVYDAFVPFSTNVSAEQISGSFEVTGSRAPLTVFLGSSVNNSWASTTIGLVNEETNEEIYATRDLEYYQGYEAGERWTEGSQNDEFNFCGVPAGKYHFIINLAKSETDNETTGVHVRAESGNPVYHNMWVVIVVSVVLIIGAYIGKDQFEQKRY
jgi:hypothetical protein